MGKGKKTSKPRAIDLYSGIGGWGLGLKLAGVDVVASYEYWGLANETNFKNNRHQAQTVDIRRLDLADLPKNIDIVVGSPPCTQFSYSNRGGQGDLDDGLEDIEKFLTIVDYLKPKFWAMENVPRVAVILQKETGKGGRLEKFHHLNIDARVFNMENFGLPQRRKRCIAGNFDFDLLLSHSQKKKPKTLGEIIKALSEDTIIDPTYGMKLIPSQMTDHIAEEFLSEEEIRLNKASKALHPVYNTMQFPDPMERSVRTITATCTRVSRESIILADPCRLNHFRRLTVRERACLQGFPITFQFYGKTYAQKLRMVGNAVPPIFSYYVAQAMQGIRPEKTKKLTEFSDLLQLPIPPAENGKPDTPGKKFPPKRNFRFAIPSLRLKSGVRFELTNNTTKKEVTWRVNFYFGTSKSIHKIDLNESFQDKVLNKFSAKFRTEINKNMTEIHNFMESTDIKNMQRIWSHSGPGLTHPLMLLDNLDAFGENLKNHLNNNIENPDDLLKEITHDLFSSADEPPPGLKKLYANATLILAGILLGCVTNSALERKEKLGVRKNGKVAIKSA